MGIKHLFMQKISITLKAYKSGKIKFKCFITSGLELCIFKSNGNPSYSSIRL